MIPAAIATGIGAALGFGAFAFFGLRSESVWSDLEKCTPSCKEEQKADAKQAETDQTYANVGLIAGGVLALATVGLVTLKLTGGATARTTLGVGPRGVALAGRF